jgi:hypothetical protein
MKNSLYVKCVIGVALLFVGASVLPTISAEIETFTPQSGQTGANWYDDFDSYAAGSGLHGQGGWEGWDGDPTYDVTIVDTYSHTPENSLESDLAGDIVHQFTGVDSGFWNFTTMTYVPSDFVGQSYFILLNTYAHGGPNHWSTQLRFDSDLGVIESEFEYINTWLVYDEWVELRVMIDFTADLQYIYYDGFMFSSKSWSEGVSGPGGAINLAAVDIFANGASPVYFDTMSLVGEEPDAPDLDCYPDIVWEEVPPESTVTAEVTIANVGAEGTLLDWSVQSFPDDWGTSWSATPASGTDLPGGDTETVIIEVTAPSDKETTFTGEITFVNDENPDDYCTILVTLTTPKSQSLVQTVLSRRIC